MHHKKTMFTILVLLGAFTLGLAACGGGTSGDEGGFAPSDNPSGHILVWGWGAALTDTLEASGVLADFEAAYPDIEVEFLIMDPADLYTNLPLAITAGQDLPDVALVENSHLSQFVHMGGGTALLDVTNPVKPYIDVMNDYKWSDCTLDGKYYCMPWDSGPVVMYYRADVFQAAGLPTDPDEVSELVATFDDYFDLCQTIKDETGAFCFANNKANNSGRLYEMMLWEQGLGYYDLDSGDLTVSSPENIATLELMGKFWDADLTSDNNEWEDPWYQELGTVDVADKPIATLVEAAWMEVFLKGWISPGTTGLWRVAEMPSVFGGGARAANNGGSTFVIPAQAENPDAAWAFVEFCLGKRESQLKMFEVSGFIPSLETTYDADIFDTPNEFFNGQATFRIYADVVARIPSAGIYGPNYDMMNRAVQDAIQQYALGNVSAKDGLEAAEVEIATNLE